jgi:hypothetical protein
MLDSTGCAFVLEERSYVGHDKESEARCYRENRWIGKLQGCKGATWEVKFGNIDFQPLRINANLKELGVSQTPRNRLKYSTFLPRSFSTTQPSPSPSTNTSDKSTLITPLSQLLRDNSSHSISPHQGALNLRHNALRLPQSRDNRLVLGQDTKTAILATWIAS